MKDKDNRKMKDSGIEWIGKIPIEWTLSKVKYGFVRKNSKAFEENPTILSLARDGVKVRDISTNEGQIAESYYEYNPVTIDDLLLNPMDIQSGANCSISKVEGVISPAYMNLRYKEGFDPQYYDYYFKLCYWNYIFFSYGKGVSFDNRWTLNDNIIMNFVIIKPNIIEQQKIANFLDEKCSKVDKIINDINKQIETLENYKKLLISNFATGKSVIIKKKISKPEKVKDSGAKYIGIIPDRWRILKVKYLMHRKTVKNMGNEQVLSLYRDYGVIPKDSRDDNYNVTSEDTSKYLYVKKGNFVINKMKAWQGSMAVSEFDGILSPAYYCYEFKSDKINKKYFHYLLRNVLYIPEYRRLSGGIREGQWDLPESEFNNLFIVIPPKDEQDEIVNYLDCKSIVIERIVSDKKQQIESLEKYKKSIIFEYITGKKKV